MTNIRIVRLAVKTNSTLELSFTHNVNTSIGVGNFTITSLSGSVDDPSIVSVVVENKIVTITTDPLVNRAYYQLVVQSTSSQTFQGARGETFIEDGATNYVFFLGPEEENFVRDDILNGLPDIYNKEAGSLIFDSVDASARKIIEALYKIQEVDSANYVSVEIENEEVSRGAGPFDRFENEGVYKVIKVSFDDSGTLSEGTISFDEFPSDPVSLQQVLVSEEEVSNSLNDSNGFNGLTISVAQKPVIKVTSITLIQNSQEYEYDIEQYRYGISTSKYDSDNSYSLIDLETNQIKLSEAAIGPSFPFPQGSDTIKVTYYYKREGRDVDASSLLIFKLEDITRESVPAVSTAFFLENAPVVDSNGNTATTNGIQWLDPAQNYSSSSNHPSFTTEIAYSATNFPSKAGEWSCNYSTGQVFVFGTDGTGVDGTTTVPPVATYKAKSTYNENIDYVFFSDLDEIASLPDGSLRGEEGTVSFEYEDTFISGTDFNFNSHVEVLNERVDNRLIDTIGLYTENGPVNEVFRIYNETTGEIYTTTRITDNEVYFSSVNPPNTEDVTRESAEFEQVLQSQLVVIEEISATGFNIFKINLEDTNIGSATGNFFGANYNTSLIFSDTETFIREFFFDPDGTLAENLDRLASVGDYVVDYESGIVYLAIASGTSTNIGDASYRTTKIETRNSHILRATDVYRSASVSLSNARTFSVSAVADTTISLSDIEHPGETEVSGSAITVSSDAITVSSDVFRLNKIFQVTDLKTSHDPINFSTGAVVSNSSPTSISLNSSGISIEDDGYGSGLVVQNAGSRQYVEAQRIADLSSSSLVELVSALTVIDMDTNEDYFSHGTDGYVDNVNNRIYLPSSAAASGKSVTATYKAKLRNGAAVLVEYLTGNMYVDYTYVQDEILISYEYGENNLDWSISNALSENETYYVTYRYGALRNALRDNFGVLSNIEELINIPENLDRETYRNFILGVLQTFPKGPTIPSVEELVETLTQITPNITESVFLEWILGRDHLNLSPMKLNAISDGYLPTYDSGKFGKGLLVNKETQTVTLPTSSNISFAEGTWETFFIPEWDGIENDATLTFDIKMDGTYRPNNIYIGANNVNPSEIPFSLNKDDAYVLGRPSKLHKETGYFVWYDTSQKKWFIRSRAPIAEERVFAGNITTTGEFNNVLFAASSDGYDGYSYEDGYNINEINDRLRSTNSNVNFSFIVDAYDSLNMSFDAYDSYGASFAGFDGIDFQSDDIHYLLDTGYSESEDRISIYKDGKGFLRFKVSDKNKRVKMLSADVSDWESAETHFIAASWKIGTIEMRDEMHLFVDGAEVPNTYKFRGYLDAPSDATFMDEATEALALSVTSPTIGGNDLQTSSGSNVVTSSGSSFITDGVQVDDQFIILDDTTDGLATRTSPYVYVKSVDSSNVLSLKTGLGADFNATSSLESIKFSLNPLTIETVSNPQVENVRVFSLDSSGEETELLSPDTSLPDYGFERDGYHDYVNIYNGIPTGGGAILRSYGLMMARCRQNAYIWADGYTNILRTKIPSPTSVAKVQVTKIISSKTSIDPAGQALIATAVGGHIVQVLNTNLSFCQPSNSVTGRKLTASLYGGSNIDFSVVNQILFLGTTYDGDGYEILQFSNSESVTSTKYFTSIDQVVVSLTPVDSTKNIGVVEVREASPLNRQENGGDYADVRLSVQDQVGMNGVVAMGDNELVDAYSRFGSEDIGKEINIISPLAIAGNYTITDVGLDASGLIKDSNTVVLNTTWGASYSNIEWQMINTLYTDSGFANGLITLEINSSGGSPFLLGNCWYEVDFPSYLTIPWDKIPETLYIGSDLNGENQANGVFDEMRLLDEMSLDTGRGESLPSSGRSITTDAAAVSEFSSTPQTLGLFHFNESVDNSANFYTTFSKDFRQSENSVNSSFNQSAIFNRKTSYEVENKAIFDKDQGTLEFWVSPILDTYNDPTTRYYIDMTPERQVTTTALTSLTVSLPSRVRSVSSVTISGSDTNYFINGSLSSDGQTVTLGQALPASNRQVTVTFVPLNSQGDRLSVFKNQSGNLSLYVRASDAEYTISTGIYWKKNSWHRIWVGWDLNNSDNQDRLIFMVDGTETGLIRYGTGLLYGTGVMYGQPSVWGSADAGTAVARNILTDINLLDDFNKIHIGADFTGRFPAMARMDDIRFSNELRSITYVGDLNGQSVGEGPGRLIGKDLLYTSNISSAQPMVSDALTTLLLNFDTTQAENENLATVRNASSGIFDFYVEVIDTFQLLDTELKQQLLTDLINKLKPAHTRAFVSFTE